MLSAANSRGPELALVTPDTVVGVRVRSLSSVVVEPSTELRSVAMAFTAVSNVIPLPVESKSPVSSPAIYKQDAHQRCSYIDQLKYTGLVKAI